jgi:NAD(P)-dependent dehydrogenase (short-subunit alcohol dehydrogenase family)
LSPQRYPELGRFQQFEQFDPLGISREHGRFERGENLDLGLLGRIAIVTAASKGLSRALAEELAREGACVAICARTDSALEQAAADIHKSIGREVFHQAVDVRNHAAAFHFVASVESRFSRIDICITNSGGPPSKMAFLASERASFVNGTSIAVDGGMVRSLL